MNHVYGQPRWLNFGVDGEGASDMISSIIKIRCPIGYSERALGCDYTVLSHVKPVLPVFPTSHRLTNDPLPAFRPTMPVMSAEECKESMDRHYGVMHKDTMFWLQNAPIPEYVTNHKQLGQWHEARVAVFNEGVKNSQEKGMPPLWRTHAEFNVLVEVAWKLKTGWVAPVEAEPVAQPKAEPAAQPKAEPAAQPEAEAKVEWRMPVPVPTPDCDDLRYWFQEMINAADCARGGGARREFVDVLKRVLKQIGVKSLTQLSDSARRTCVFVTQRAWVAFLEENKMAVPMYYNIGWQHIDASTRPSE